MKVAIASHAPVWRNGDGWVTKNRVGVVADRLAATGSDVTLLAVESGPQSFLTHRLSGAVRVDETSGLVRRASAVVRLLRADATLVFMPTVRTALLALVGGRRAVVYFGNCWSGIPGTPRWRAVLESLVARRAGCVVVHGQELERRFLGIARRVVQCVPLVPDEVGMRLRDGVETPKPDGPLRVLFVGSLVPQKGVGELLEAVRGLDGVECRVVGPAADATLVRALEDAAAAGVLRYQTYLEWPELREAYLWADVLALPSYYEGFPRVVYEAAAFGLAPLVTPVGSLPDRLREGESAVFVPVADAGALRDALSRLAADRTLVAEVARGARDTLRPLFASGDSAAQFASLLAAVARGRGAAAGAWSPSSNEAP